MQPGACGLPVAFDSSRGYVECESGLFDRHAAEEAQLDDAGLLRINGFEPFEGRIEAENVHRRFRLRQLDARQGDLQPAVSFCGRMTPGMVDENVAHEPGYDADEMSTVLILNVGGAFQPQECFVHQGRGLQRMVTALPRELTARRGPELRIGPVDHPVPG